ncbi:peptide ABC transporter substrate-binding protein [Mesobacillus campisalis]|uniref:Peptide ABC transporter substrate-binding protein n=1 Tax=Mesobacillus campisalis TaxID=1408103 RepID=A0A0M2STU2_9BACI|nr:ABC transporter substrate-binding protein [Mesobacillus campisalis]KKK36397.1 peptide ABC transporter substrate-binding protein [Mesobacillus campisalis]
MKIPFRFMLAAVIISLVLSACSNAASNEDNEKKEQEKTKEQVLIFGRGADSYSMDPQNANEIETWRVSKNVYETLVEYEKETTNVIPKLAKDWEVSEDGKTWKFNLQEGIKFHDGTDFNAEAVVYNFERMMDPSHPARHDATFSVYRGMFNGFKGDGSVIEEVNMVDPHTVEFKLSEPQANFLSNLGMHAFGIISPAALKKYGADIHENAVGTGPFKLESWIPNDSVTLVKNVEYWKENSPQLDKLIYKVIPDNTSRLTALKNGEIDIMVSLNPSDLKSLENDNSYQLLLRPALNVGYLSINNQKEPLNNIKVRQAINHAIDKKGIADAFFYGLAEPVKNMLPSESWAYNHEIEDYEYNLDKAKSLLAEAGYPNGFELEFAVTSNSRIYMQQPTKMVEAMKASLEKIGVNVKIVSYEWAAYIDQLRNGEHSIGLIGWVGDNGDPDNFLYSMLSKNNAVKGAAQNHTFYVNDEVSDLLMKAKSVMDEQERTEIYKQVQKLVHEDAPSVPLVEVKEPVVTADYVKGYIPHPTGAENMDEVTLED